jgi:hypothetical protein
VAAPGGSPWFSMSGAALNTVAASRFSRVSAVFQFGFVHLFCTAEIALDRGYPANSREAACHGCLLIEDEL